MKGIVADALVGKLGERWRVDRAAKGIRQTKPDIVEQDNNDIGRVFRQVIWLNVALMLRDSCADSAATLADGTG